MVPALLRERVLQIELIGVETICPEFLYDGVKQAARQCEKRAVMVPDGNVRNRTGR
jgi:hypothetical protein